MADELTKNEFCARFIAQMMKALPIYAGTEAELREYAEQAAPTYFDMADWPEDTPEGWATTDISYWEDE